MKTMIYVMVILISTMLNYPPDFLTEQKKYERVRTCIAEKEETIKLKLQEKALSLDNFHVLFVAYKDNDELAVYVKKKSEKSYELLTTYKICARSGQLGPKRKSGDGQVPEGFYYVNRFNPQSSFYVSLGLNYPNEADRKKSTATNLGGDIFIHGSCVTIGCMPMTDEKIKEIYLYAIHAKNNGQAKIPVYVFPYKMTDTNQITYREKYKEDKNLTDFWNNLKPGYDKFLNEKKELNFLVNAKGDYQF